MRATAVANDAWWSNTSAIRVRVQFPSSEVDPGRRRRGPGRSVQLVSVLRCDGPEGVDKGSSRGSSGHAEMGHRSENNLLVRGWRRSH